MEEKLQSQLPTQLLTNLFYLFLSIDLYIPIIMIPLFKELKRA